MTPEELRVQALFAAVLSAQSLTVREALNRALMFEDYLAEGVVQ